MSFRRVSYRACGKDVLNCLTSLATCAVHGIHGPKGAEVRCEGDFTRLKLDHYRAGGSLWATSLATVSASSLPWARLLPGRHRERRCHPMGRRRSTLAMISRRVYLPEGAPGLWNQVLKVTFFSAASSSHGNWEFIIGCNYPMSLSILSM
jgi:hypothetical protein